MKNNKKIEFVENTNKYYDQLVNQILEKGTDAIDKQYLIEQGYSPEIRKEVMRRIFKGY